VNHDNNLLESDKARMVAAKMASARLRDAIRAYWDRVRRERRERPIPWAEFERVVE